jgi:hypothetical protein
LSPIRASTSLTARQSEGKLTWLDFMIVTFARRYS